MPFDDLDLEFEDEDEAKKKKNDAVHQDVNLEFSSPEGGYPELCPGTVVPAPAPATVAPNSTATTIAMPNSIATPAATANKAGAVVKKLDDARVAKPVGPARVPITKTSGSSALAMAPHFDSELEELVALRERVQKVEFESAVKVSVAEYKTELLSDLLSDMKLMDHQVGQMLARINAKHPDMKQEILMIKKILADFTSKKRK